MNHIRNPRLPGISEVDEGLEETLRRALAAKGPDYTPRTRHLDGEAPRYVNRLIEEQSPYLLQHAHNPVNWAPWGEEAFARARREDKPIFLSVGYSTCHWCHVMEHESFENETIAAYLNAHFVPIKVDREERPDIDDLYMNAVYMLAGRGGWPMTVVLTPDGDPFFAGTYFPPRQGVRGARRGLMEILEELSTRYRESPAQVVTEAQALSQRLQRSAAPARPAAIPPAPLIASAAQRISASYDRTFGGFGRAPKFPQPSRLGLLLRVARRTDNEALQQQVLHTLHAMAGGGMYDHVGGGFHRYATDARWLVPHFEKMLYDNAQLAVSYLEGYQASGEEDFLRVARETLDYVAREMTREDGAFYSATDADSMTPNGHREEGYYFTWTPQELDAALPPPLRERVQAYYPTNTRGNFEGRNILWTPEPLSDVAAQLGVAPGDLRADIDRARDLLRETRNERPLPLRDDKILTAWNGLMISAFARGAFVLNEPRYEAIALRAAETIHTSLRDEGGRLMRNALGAHLGQRAYLQDYAMFIAALLDVHELRGDDRWLTRAIALQQAQDEHFLHEAAGGYYSTANDAEELLTRDKPFGDGALPSGNSVALDNLLRLHALTDDDGYRQQAEALLSAFGSQLTRRATGAPRLLMAFDRYTDTPREVVIIERQPGDGAPLVDVLRRTFLPNRVLLVRQDGHLGDLSLLEGKAVLEGNATAYVCERGRCQLPTSNPATLMSQLSERRPYD